LVDIVGVLRGGWLGDAVSVLAALLLYVYLDTVGWSLLLQLLVVAVIYCEQLSSGPQTYIVVK
jgi:hypothetical protein